MPRRAAIAASLAAVALLLAACSAPIAPHATPPTPLPGTTAAPFVVPVGDPQTVVSGLEAPWSIVFVDGSALISERDSGVILEVVADGTRRVGTVPGVVHRGESGLLGLAVDRERRLYAYSTGETGNRIQRFALRGDPGSFRLGAPEQILAGIPAAGNHNGGRLAFGPDGMLYATTGDAGRGENAQDVESLGGKILRMTPEGDPPADNPFPGSLVYSLGHRNVQGIAWDANGRLFASEFGQNTWDELNIVTAGANYGWPTVEGIGGDPRFVDPVQQWTPERASPSAITIVDGSIFIANLRGEVLRVVPTAQPSEFTDYWQGEHGRIRDVVRAPDATLWVLTNNTDGRGSPHAGDDRVLSVALDVP